jgi:hypothetical protein
MDCKEIVLEVENWILLAQESNKCQHFGSIRYSGRGIS